ncbi:MAG: lamin tail domain-containing protein, partial [Ignavibacteriales bacterium]|nr:lamin tail domain-containing protein [Ignavibacteriales bacterium]
MKLLQTLLFTLFFFSITFSQTTHIVISEFATRGTANATDEFVELYNPMDSVIDISGWKLEYKSASGTTWSLRATIPNNKTIPAFGFFLIAPTSYASSTTPDYRATEWSAGAADNGHFHITNVGGTEIDKVGYGTAIDPEGSPAPNHGTSANNNSVERKAKASSTADSLCSTGTHALIGNGQDTQQNNLDFVARTCNRNPQNTLSPTEPPGGTNLCDGSGIASVSPHSAQGNIPTNFVVKYFRNTQYTISDMRFVMPSSFSWSHSLDSVSITNATASVSIVADTILFEGITFSSDSSEITIRNVTPPDSTASFKIKVQTRCTTFREITTSPTVLVVGSPIPIASVKENDSLGIPIRNGQYVTLRGIVTVGNEFCSPSYMQDNTAGIGMFGTTTSAALTIGDDVIISGRVTHFNGFTQIDNLTLQQTLSQGNEVEPIVLTVSQVNEQNEGILAKILAVTVRDTFGNAISTWDCGTSGRNYRLYESPTAFTQIRADNCVNICGTTAPQDEIDLIGVVGQFDPSAPHNTGY